MTITTKTPYPENAKSLTNDGTFTPAFQRFIQGIYDLQGSSAGAVQFNNVEIGLKNGSATPGIDTNILYMGGVQFNDSAPINGGILQATSNSSVSFVDPAESGIGGRTGDLKFSLADTVPGYLKLVEGQTIGNSSSGATGLASNITENLFKHIWNTYETGIADVTGGAGESADEDWAAGKTIELPKLVGRTIRSTTDASQIGTTGGLEKVLLEAEHINSHNHTLYGWTGSTGNASGVPQGDDLASAPLRTDLVVTEEIAWVQEVEYDFGGGTATSMEAPRQISEEDVTGEDELTEDYTQDGHQNLQPELAVNWFIKL